MYALYRKIRNGYSIDVNVLAVSEDKEELMMLLPYEVERYLRSKSKRLGSYDVNIYLPNGYQPLDYWARGAFDEEKFEVVETSYCETEFIKCHNELNKLREENERCLAGINDCVKARNRK